MQGLWSSGLPKHACRCVSCLSAGSNAVAGRTATAASRRRLLLGNSVTAFYSTIFAGAMFWDVKVKEKKREEWRKQIEDVKEDIKRFQDEEARLVEEWEMRRRERQLALPMQRRQYSTVSWAPTNGPARPHGIQQPTLATRPRNHSLPSGYDRPDLIRDGLFSQLVENDTKATCLMFGEMMSKNLLRKRRIQQLAMRQLAIQLLLRPGIAHTYLRVRADDKSKVGLLPNLETTELLIQLAQIREEIRYLKRAKYITDDRLAPSIGSRERIALVEERREQHVKLLESFRQFRNGNLQLSSLLVIVSDHLLQSQEPILPITIELLITEFTRAKQNDIVKMILDAFILNRFLLSTPIIVASINFFTKTRDLYRFDGLLRLLQGHGCPVDVHDVWESVRVEGVEVPVPPEPRHPFILSALITAALSFDQPHRAKAWLRLLRQTGHDGDVVVIGSFLRFYSVSLNWRDGRFFLQKALAFIRSTESHVKTEVERLILYMVIFCNSCGQTQLSQTIIKAAVKCGLDWKQCVNGRDSRAATKEAFQQWDDATKLFLIDVPSHLSPDERYQIFTNRVDHTINAAVAAPLPPEEPFDSEPEQFPHTPGGQSNAFEQIIQKERFSPPFGPEPVRDPSPIDSQNNALDQIRETYESPVPKIPVKTAENRAPEAKQESPTFRIRTYYGGTGRFAAGKTCRDLRFFNKRVPRSSGVAL